MTYFEKLNTKMSTVFVALLSIVMLSSIKISYLVGSYFSFLSISSVISSVSGLAAGGAGIGAILLVRVIKMSLLSTQSWTALAVHLLPGLAAGLYWTHYRFIVRFILPLFCIGLFVIHPVGYQAFFYSALWLIPLIVYLSDTNSLFLHALSSTFIAHAVGSVMWLYTIPMTSAMWIALIPIVLVERTFFALGTIATYTLAIKVTALAKKYVYKIIQPLFSY